MSEVILISEGRGYSLYPHKTTKWDAAKALQFTSTMLTTFQRTGFVIVGAEGKAAFRILDLSDEVYHAEKAVFKSFYPDMMVRDEPAMLFSYIKEELFPYHYSFIPLQTWGGAEIPIIYVDDLTKDADPIAALAQSMGVVQENEMVVFSIFVNRPHKPLYHKGTQFFGNWKRYNELRDRKTYQRNATAYETVLESKKHANWYECFIGLEVYAPSRERVAAILEVITPKIYTFDRRYPNQPHNGLTHWEPGAAFFRFETVEDAITQSFLLGYNETLMYPEMSSFFQNFRTFLEPRELAALWHIPHQGIHESSVYWNVDLPQAAPKLLKNQVGITLGAVWSDDEFQFVKIPDTDRATHMNIIGKTGVGKSTFMRNLITQTIEQGDGVMVIDPHGSLVQSILRQSIPPEREQDVVVLDLSDAEHPIPLNLFAGDISFTALGRVVDILETIYTTGVRMDKYIRAGIQAVQHIPETTMRDMYLLFTDAHFRQTLLAQLDQKIQVGEIFDDEILQTLFDEYHELGDAKQREIRAPILNRISPFYANPYLYPILCHPHRLDFGSLIANNKIILISLGVNSQLVPDKEQGLVGSLIISLIQMLGMTPARKNYQGAPFYVYVDEVQNFATGSLEVLFSEARKFGLSLTVAHQYFSQLTTDTMQGIMGNVGATISFQCDAGDANAIAPYMKPQFDVERLVKLDKHQCAAKIRLNGKDVDAFTLFPLPPTDEPEDASEREQRIRALSAQTYTPMTRSQVIEWLNKRYPPKSRGITPPPPKDSGDDDFNE